MKKELFSMLFFFLVTTLFFFYPVLKGHIPFPGDLLVSSTPYNTYSYLGYPAGGVPNKAQGPDVMHELFPWKFLVIDSLKSGQIPFWTPYNFSGNTLMANFQSGTFYPLNIVFFVLPFLSGWTVFIVLAPLLSAVFTYLFLRELKLSKWPSAFGGIVFAFSSYMVVWMEYGNITHALSYLPLALYLTEKYFQKNTWQSIVALTLTLWFALLAGYIQGFFYLYIILFVYFFVKLREEKNKKIKKAFVFLGATIFPVVLSLFQLLPTLALFTMSSRGEYTLQQITELLNPWWYIITVLVPDFFGNPASRNSWFSGTYIERVSFFGVIPLLFAIVALFASKKKELKVFALLFLVSFLVALDLFFTRYLYQLPIPVLSTTVPTRVLSIFVFCGAILSAYGFQLFLEGKNKKRFVIVGLSVSIFLLVIWLSLFSPQTLIKAENVAIVKRNLILPALFTFVFLGVVLARWFKHFQRLPYWLTILTVILFVATIGDLFYFFHKITPFSPRAFVYPQTDVINYIKNNAGVNRYWGYGSGYIRSNFQTYDKTFSPEGFDALHLRWYTEFLSASNDGKVSEIVSRDNANVAPGYGPEDLRSNPNRQKVLNLVGIKYILFKNEAISGPNQPDFATFPKESYKLIWQKSPWQIYENLQVAPRFFLTDQYHVILERDQTIQKIYSQQFDEKKEVILTKNPEIKKGQLTKKDVTLLSYTPNKVAFQTNADADSLLFLSDTYSPNWQVKIDNEKRELLVADHAFRAVVVPTGQHTVTFFYNDKGFNLGLLLSIFGLAGFITFILIIRKYK